MTFQQTKYRKLKLFQIFTSSVGCFFGIGVIAYLTNTTGASFIIPPFGATCIIIFLIPDSAFARPRNIIVGHLLCSVVGMVCLSVWGTSWQSYAFAAGISSALMQLSRSVHPPAAADPILLIMQGNIPPNFLLAPVLLGSVALVVIAIFYHNLLLKHPYPRNISIWSNTLFDIPRSKQYKNLFR